MVVVCRMRIYAGFILSECSCISAGLGAYPTHSHPTPGQVHKTYSAARYFTFRRLFWLSNSFKVSHLRDALDTDIAIDPTSRVSDKSKSWMADI